MDADQVALTTRIDEALDQFRGRDLVAGSEVVDLLLDLRLMLLAADTPAPVNELSRAPARNAGAPRGPSPERGPVERIRLASMDASPGSSCWSRRAAGRPAPPGPAAGRDPGGRRRS